MTIHSRAPVTNYARDFLVAQAVRDRDFSLLVGDALAVLPTLDGPFDAVVTSPPYSDARDDVGAVGLDVYHLWAHEWLRLLIPILAPRGSVMLNLGRRRRDGEEHGYWLLVLEAARGLGYRWLDTIVWHKVNGGGGRRVKHLIDRHEYVFWLARSTEPYRGLDDARRPYSPATLARYTRRWRAENAVAKGIDGDAQEGRVPHPAGALPGSVFTSSVGVEKGNTHPTPMDADLAEWLVQLSCPPGGLVLDPFAGSGTTALACRKLGRRCVAVEIDPVHADECARRLSQQSLLAEPA